MTTTSITKQHQICNFKRDGRSRGSTPLLATIINLKKNDMENKEEKKVVICLPKSSIRKIASYELESIAESKKAMQILFATAHHTMELRRELRAKIAKSVWYDHSQLIEEEWECFKVSEIYKVANSLVDSNNFQNLKKAISFMCD